MADAGLLHPAGRRLAICVAGGGAIGSLLAWHFAKAGHDVHVIARGAQLAALRARGSTLGAPDGSAETVAVAASDGRDLPVQQLIFVTTKAHQVAGIRDVVLAASGPETVIVPVINGVPWWYFMGGSAEIVQAVDPDGGNLAAFAGCQLVGAVIYAMVEMVGPGHIRRMAPSRLLVGAVAGDERLGRAVAAVVAAGLAIDAVADIRAEVWSKLLGNLSSNPLSVLVGAGLGRIYRDNLLAPVVRAVMDETVAVARAYGVIPSKTPEQILAIGGQAGDFATSMLQDYRRGVPLETAAVGDAVLELAARAGVAVPTLAALLSVVKFQSLQSLQG